MSRSAKHTEAEILVAGLGPTGLAAAIALAQQGFEVSVAGRSVGTQADTRTAALMGPAVRLIERLGAWPHCRDMAAPLAAIRIVDDTGRLLAAPEVLFRAEEIGEAAFGWNVPNAALTAALLRAAQDTRGLAIVETQGFAGVAVAAAGARITPAEGGLLRARLLVAADGRSSPCRRAAGIGERTWDYGQTALACSFSHSRTHEGVSTELHRPAGPLTLVPLPGRASSLVWVEAHERARLLMALDEAAFVDELEARLAGLLGKIAGVGPRAAFSLSGLRAERLTGVRTALVGEAAHVMPPIGAQGLNLGLRDVAVLADVLIEARRAGRDIGGTEALGAFEAARRSDVWTRMMGVDLLNRSLLSELLPVQTARGLGLHLLRGIGPLRRLAMRQGMAPGGLPSLMR